jgi:hypothetical protein
VLNTPAARRAYLLTKLGVFAAATLATWPLAEVFGPRAWWALVAFGTVLAVVTATVLATARTAAGRAAPAAEDDAESEGDWDPSRPVVLPVEDAIDLHPFKPGEVPRVVRDYLEAAHAEGFREVRLIHGRGIGVQRERVRSLLSDHPLVEAFHDAPPPRGGWGATVALLRDEPGETSSEF